MNREQDTGLPGQNGRVVGIPAVASERPLGAVLRSVLYDHPHALPASLRSLVERLSRA
jgi:hypothetical protein